MFDKNVNKLPGARRAWALLFATSAVDAALIVGQALGLACAVDGIWRGQSFQQVIAWVGMFLLSFALRQAVLWIRRRFLDGFSRRSVTLLRRRLLERLYAQGPDFVQVHGSGSTVAMLIDGIDKTRTYIALTCPKVTDLLVLPTLLAIALLLIDPISGVIAVIILPCIIAYMRLLGGFAKEAAARQHGQFVRMSNHFIDTLRGLDTIHVFGRTRSYGNRVFRVSEQFRQATNGTLKAATLSSLVLDLFRTFAVAAVAIMLGFRLMAGKVALTAALAVLVIVPEYFAAVRRYASDFHASLDGRNNLAAIMDALGDCELTASPDSSPAAPDASLSASLAPTRETPDSASPASPPVPGDAVSSGQRNAAEGREASAAAVRLTADRIGFAYSQAEGSALQEISFSVQGPAKVGIFGASGSGKSTLARLLAGYSSPTCGTFTVDGIPSSTLAVPGWQRTSTYIPQNPHLFHGTLRENIAFYRPEASEEEILRAVRIVGLDELLSQLPDGLDTLVGEGGRTLSGGQVQRVALSRALLDADRHVMVFDEPTAHLDIETELACKQLMLPLMEDHLVFFATHRLHWAADMDFLLVLENGRIVQQGTYRELSAVPGPFADLVASYRGGRHA